MKKIRVILGVSAALSCLSALAFVNNLVAIFNWWRAFAAAEGDTSGVPAHAPGCFGWLDWSAVDYSAVTTFIPMLGFFFMTRAAFALARGKRVPADDFPFFRGSDQLNVALGLFGTLWGIIVIGYFKLETVQMADLMQCLHTALFSTLMAVVWVFLFDRPLVRPYFLKLLEEQQLAEASNDDLAFAVERLVKNLGAASEAFEKREAEFEQAFAAREAAYEKSFTEREAAREKAFAEREAAHEKAFETRAAAYENTFAKQLAECEKAFAEREAAYGQAFAKQLAEYEKAFEVRQKEYKEFFMREIAELEKRAAEAEERVKSAEKHAANSESKIKAVLAALQE